MPAAPAPPLRSRRGPSPFRWAAPYWAIGFGVAIVVQLELIPVKQWLAGSPTPAVTQEAAPVEPAPVEREPTPRPPAPVAWLPPRGGTPHATFHSFGAPPAPVDPAPTPGPAPAAAEPEPEPRKAVRRRKRRPNAPPATTSRRRAAAPPTPKPKRRAKRNEAVSRSGGQSCSAAIASYRENVKMGDKSMPADLTAARYGAVLNRGTYFSHCGVPDTMRVHICAAVQNGVAVGVTVTTDPGSARVASCIAGAVRGLSFPSHPRMDVTRTTFE